MDNRAIASVLKQIAVYMELGGENPFKSRAFASTARSIESFHEEMRTLAAEERLTEIKGVGKNLAEVIAEIVATGESSVLNELACSFPAGLTDLLTIPGMGPKKVRAVWQNLDITSVGELEYACRENRLIALPGFGARTQKKILEAIGFRKQYAGQYLFSDAQAIAEEIVGLLEQSGRFSRVQTVGSLRRGMNTFKDADLLLVPRKGVQAYEVRDLLTSLADENPDIRGVISAGETEVSIRRAGLQVSFRIVAEEAYPAALQHFTGSMEHNAQLRSLARARNLEMNEHGVYRGEEPLTVSSEEDVYGSLGLAWIPPETREADGEIEAAAAGELPMLVALQDVRGMVHVHSRYSDGLNTIEEMAGECRRRGYTYLCLSDHSRSAFYAGGLTVEDLAAQREEVERLNERMAPFRIYCGVESDILGDGSLDYEEGVLSRLDFVIASVHSNLAMPGDEATRRLVAAVRNPYTTILGHSSGRLLLSREGYTFDEQQLLDAMAQEGVALEHNCHPQRLDADWTLMKRARRMGIKIAIDPDAHQIAGLDDMRYGISMARKAWLTAGDVLNCMGAEEIGEWFKIRRQGAAER